jgi:hypothetical protein
MHWDNLKKMRQKNAIKLSSPESFFDTLITSTHNVPKTS